MGNAEEGLGKGRNSGVAHVGTMFGESITALLGSNYVNFSLDCLDFYKKQVIYFEKNCIEINPREHTVKTNPPVLWNALPILGMKLTKNGGSASFGNFST